MMRSLHKSPQISWLSTKPLDAPESEMSYTQMAAAAQELGELRAAAAKIPQAEAKLLALLPFLGDDIFVLIAAELDARTGLPGKEVRRWQELGGRDERSGFMDAFFMEARDESIDGMIE